ncbi:SusC/RagA family TonB-linked outer membrane protein [Autumnicola psychrophila]|uniref:SusC/RagA family TonB-linked outer membrane protein n=1 Tax=Autumnicola psychrophila TaxID=3075592 RepID=A0ABU3DMT2_9FLAO|nr:SusC/RagA family TonB-linked outer membrane protein [Zunongwangia sp. F225]MDT0685024.1 SusC/RagA family TonB-linked outer membrane protein [Zunongwangia sp. F225]
MKQITLKIILCTLIALLPVISSAQTATKIDLTTVVRTEQGLPVQGAIVRSEQDDISTQTDSLGIFSLEVSSNATLSVNTAGYGTKFATATPGLQEIVLDSDLELVQVAYQKEEKEDLLGGISYINIPELLDKNYITYPLDNMEALVPGFHGNLWGMNEYLVLIDGVPRDIGSVQPTAIDQISFLKGVSAVALYGSRAAKGAVLITTKGGHIGEQTVDVRVNAGLFAPRSFPKYLGSAEYMTLYNEARNNDGLGSLYSEEEIYHHSAGTNPYRYPNLDYYTDDYLQSTYSRYDGTMEIAGGNEVARYYTNLGFMTEGSLLNFGEAENNKNQRFNVRGNVDMNLNDNISAHVDLAAIFTNNVGVNADYWGGAANLRPHRFTPFIPISMIEENDEASWDLIEGTDNLIGGQYLLGGTQLDQSNPIADIYAGGSNTYISRQFQFNAGVDADLQNLLKGLSFSSLFGIDYATSYNQSFNNEYSVFEPSWTNYAGTDMISSLTRYGQDISSGDLNVSNSLYRQTLAFSGQLNYETVIEDDHDFSAMLIAGGFQRSQSGVYHGVNNANLGLHLGYDYKNKYYAQFSGAMIYSTRVPEDNRTAFSPTASLGWRISEEDFLASSSVVDNLKLSVSAGILHTDLDISDYYLYESIYTQTDGAWYGWADLSAPARSTDSRRGANPNLTLPKREEVSVGLDASLFNNLLVLNGNVFVSKMTGLVDQLSVLYPSYFETGYPNSSFIPYTNYNEDIRKGFDFGLTLQERTGQVDWTVGLVGTYYTTEASKRAEFFENEYQNRQGRPVDAIWGLESDGFFESSDDITNSPESAFGEVQPGDIKYVDQNADGLINAQDEVYLGRGGWSGSPFTGGINLTAKYKNFTFFAMGVGRSGAIGMKDNDYFWVNGQDKYSEVVRDRWTEATMETATYPRLTTGGGNNNFRNSDFWEYSTNRFDLARVQVSYTFPETMINGNFLQEFGVYVNGANLLTIASNKDIMELNIGGAPQTRFFNVGVKALF